MNKIITDKKLIKAHGCVYTPIDYVRTMLDSMDVDWNNIDDTKTWLDPTAGEGVFILELAKRGVQLKNLYGCDLLKDNVIYIRKELLKFFGNTKENIALIKNNFVCKDALEYDYNFDGK